MSLKCIFVNTGCPILPGRYYVNNVTVVGIDNPLAFYMVHNQENVLEIEFFSKSAKKTIRLAQVTFLGGAKQSSD